jgi:hypothetical protein
MTTMMRSGPVALLILMLSLVAAGVPAWADEDHERARAALERGEVLPLRTILDRAEAEVGGKLLEAELEAEGGRLAYEIKLLTPAGHIVELTYDARTGVLLGAKGPSLETLRSLRGTVPP